MKSLIYTYSEKTKRNQATEKTVLLYRVVRNVPTFVGRETDTFVSEFQLVLMAMERLKVLPKAAFARTSSGGYKYGTASALEEAGFAKVRGVGFYAP